MKYKKLYGIVCANITPMDRSGQLDIPSLRKLVSHMSLSGIHGVYPTGTNGEGLLLSKQEQHAVAKTVVEENAGKMSAFIQCAAMNWEDTMENVAFACSVGADGVGVMTPTFYKADDTVMADYYREACLAAGDRPLYVYSIPRFTNNDVSPETFGRIIDENPNAMGIKYSSADLVRIQDYLRSPKTRKADALIGFDRLIVSALACGCAGDVSGPACVFPRRYVCCYEAYTAGDTALAQKLQEQIIACTRQMQTIPQIPAIKAMLKMQGIIENDTCRRPFRPLNLEEYRLLEKVLDDYEKENY